MNTLFTHLNFLDIAMEVISFKTYGKYKIVRFYWVLPENENRPNRVYVMRSPKSQKPHKIKVLNEKWTEFRRIT